MSHPTGPAAQASTRVPRTRLEGLFAPGTPAAPVRIAIGTVVSVDTDETCTVLIGSDEIGGVVFLGYPPQAGDLVEVEIRGDLYVIRTSLTPPADVFAEGQNSDAPHYVSADTPPLPASRQVPVGGSMRDPDAWYFLPPDPWTDSLDPTGVGVRCVQTGTAAGTLWSDAVFDVDMADTLDLTVVVQQNGGAAATVQLYLCYDATETGNVLPGGDVQVVAAGAPVVASGTVTVTTTHPVPDTITTPTTGTGIPRQARLGVGLSAAGTADLTVGSVQVVQNPGSQQLGAIWFDPDAATGGVLTTDRVLQGPLTNVNLPDTAGAWVRAPGINKAVITAPPDCAGIVIAFGFLSLVTGSTPTVDIDFRVASNASSPVSSPFMRLTQGAAQSIPVVLYCNAPLLAGETAEIWLDYRYPNPPGAATFNHRLAGIQLVFLPGAVRGGGFTTDPMTRYWDGDSWRPDLLRGPTIDTSQAGTVVPPAKTSTTTSCTRTPGSGVTPGQKVTLTGTVTPAAGGSVTFSKGPSASGPWTVLGSGTLSGGKATKTWTAKMGTWWFQASYQGNATYATSVGVTGSSLIVANDVPGPKIKTQTLAATYCQPYNGSGGQLSGSGNDTAAHQGYYSSTHGNRKTLVGFAPSLPADAVVLSVKLICTGWNHWYYNAGGTLVVGWHQSASAPASWPGTVHPDQSRHQVGTGSWTVNLSGWASKAVTGATFQGLTLGPGPSESVQYYGYSDTPGRNQLKLQIDYQTYT